jgi:hypothetical protein
LYVQQIKWLCLWWPENRREREENYMSSCREGARTGNLLTMRALLEGYCTNVKLTSLAISNHLLFLISIVISLSSQEFLFCNGIAILKLKRAQSDARLCYYTFNHVIDRLQKWLSLFICLPYIFINRKQWWKSEMCFDIHDWIGLISLSLCIT